MFRKTLVLALVMLVFSYLAVSSREKWPYSLKRGNFHIHSSFSNEARMSGTFALVRNLGLGDLDHVVSLDPDMTCRVARFAGLNILGFSDHGEYMTGTNWEKQKRITGVYQNDSFTALSGFEWTKEGMINSDNLPVAHCNVFGSNNFTSTRTKFTGYGITGTGKIGKNTPTFKEFCDWVIEEGKSSRNLVCQLNHPTYGNYHFDNYNFSKNREILKDYFALIEVGSGPIPIYVPLKKGEKEYQKALASGLWVAPTIGLDNFAPVTNEIKKFHTDVWVENSLAGSSKEKVLSALLQRKTYASEDDNLFLKYWANLEGDNQTYYLGDKISLDRGHQITLSAEVNDPDESVGNIQLVEITTRGLAHTNLDSSKKNNIYIIAKFPSKYTIAYYIKIVQRDGDVIISAPIGAEVSVPEVRHPYRPDPSQKVDILEALRGFFNFELIFCTGIKKDAYGTHEPIGITDVFYSGKSNFLMIIKFANLDREYKYPCMIKTILYNPAGEIIRVNKYKVDAKIAEEGLKPIGQTALTQPGTYMVEGFVNDGLYVRKFFKLIK